MAQLSLGAFRLATADLPDDTPIAVTVEGDYETEDHSIRTDRWSNPARTVRVDAARPDPRITISD